MPTRKKTAMDRIEYHEKICRIMQKETFEKIDKLEARILRIEKWIIGGLATILLAVLSQNM